ncbi:hypothetical protein [Phormidesmis sp. 146-33]
MDNAARKFCPLRTIAVPLRTIASRLERSPPISNDRRLSSNDRCPTPNDRLPSRTIAAHNWAIVPGCYASVVESIDSWIC